MFDVQVLLFGPTGKSLDLITHRKGSAQIIPQLNGRLDIMLVIEGARASLVGTHIVDVRVAKELPDRWPVIRQRDNVERRFFWIPRYEWQRFGRRDVECEAHKISLLTSPMCSDKRCSEKQQFTHPGF